MTPGQLQHSLLRGTVLLKDVGLFSERRRNPDYSALLPAHVRQLPYPKLWETCLREGWYDIRLMDESFMQFKLNSEFSYSYYESPVKGQDFETFAFERIGEDWQEIETDLREEYESYVNSLPRDWPSTPIRFDYSPSLYRTPGHPAAHMHFGFASNVRMATRRIMSPEAFVLFIIRQCYPERWDTLIGKRGAAYLRRRVRDSLNLLGMPHWSPMEECEIYLF